LTFDHTPVSHLARVICDTCGRDNPGHLMFCQECGQKLAQRLATPTPPQGVPPLIDLAPQSKASAQRPPAPEINFSRKNDAPGEDRVSCPLCGSRNQRGLRFCVTCGHLLAQGEALKSTLESNSPAARASPPPPAPRASAPPPAPRTSAPPPAPIAALAPIVPLTSVTPLAPVAPIAPNRVVQLGEVVPAAPEARVCPRCRGTSEGQYCRFCGASLADAPAAPRAIASMRPSLDEARAAPVAARPTSPPAPPTPAESADGVTDLRSTAAMVSPSTTRARLVLIARDGGEGPSYPVGETTDIGRSEGNIVIGDDRYVSPRHARISLRGGAYHLRDLGSSNGVFLRIPFAAQTGAGDGASALGAEANPEQPLGDQELFLVGQQVLRFEVVKHAEEGFGVASDNGTLLFGTPATPRYGRLCQRTVEGVVRDVFHLKKGETVIGRESGDIVFTDDPFLSRRHAVVRVHGALGGTGGGSKGARRFTLADLGSSNGTFLQIREEVRLRPGDHFRIGQQLFRFDLDAARTGE
jgi:pSer/pThr/pTyr-binding forkhead associated (FHA) protein